VPIIKCHVCNSNLAKLKNGACTICGAIISQKELVAFNTSGTCQRKVNISNSIHSKIQNFSMEKSILESSLKYDANNNTLSLSSSEFRYSINSHNYGYKVNIEILQTIVGLIIYGLTCFTIFYLAYIFYAGGRVPIFHSRISGGFLSGTLFLIFLAPIIYGVGSVTAVLMDKIIER
jgi:hypothetical protein